MMCNSEPCAYWLHAQCIFKSFLPLLVEKGSLAAPIVHHLVAWVQALLQHMIQRCQHACTARIISIGVYLPYFCASLEARRLIPIAINALTTADHVGTTCCCQSVNSCVRQSSMVQLVFSMAFSLEILMPRLRPKGIQLLTSWSSFTRSTNSAAV